MKRYLSYEQLELEEKQGRDYRVRFRWGPTGIAVMAPHGGRIEPGTGEIAEGVAGWEHSFYCFEGLKKEGNLSLHIPSPLFNEPIAIRVAESSHTVVTIHGCKTEEEVIFIGGRDELLASKIGKKLETCGFSVRESHRLPGIHPMNLCNRCRSGKGVQIEISASLRRSMFRFSSSRFNWLFKNAASTVAFQQPVKEETTKTFSNLVAALREGLR
ncbi:MAG: poly-gamma-glutamate hydrolase family protein [Deltaproteobacteria bacterium]|nr:poly-gamma-glutamate hydrolase family protein [Deltaproteobacteria bacterium]MBW2016028.1 poly-gamma-glutamate hydrolase family protein [Deltaproteobacteria bacterium]MBW2128325.1 poly-gamma-glutamate hydrolase family protein [Deltaproteobacteria bacterium]